MAENWKTFVGHMSDRELSRRFGVSASTVRRYRTQQRITPHNPQNAEMPEGLMDKLATSTDYKLMTEFGISVSRVKAVRTELGVPEQKPIRPRFVPLEDGIWTDEALALLGTMPDPQLADRLGVSRTPVKKKRAELGIERTGLRFQRLRLKLQPSLARSRTVHSLNASGCHLALFGKLD